MLLWIYWYVNIKFYHFYYIVKIVNIYIVFLGIALGKNKL